MKRMSCKVVFPHRLLQFNNSAVHQSHKNAIKYKNLEELKCWVSIYHWQAGTINNDLVQFERNKVRIPLITAIRYKSPTKKRNNFSLTEISL